tara:strand:- start:130 stop:366 length:237 start_codon:yes stop_codon:yes gene_type:complete
MKKILFLLAITLFISNQSLACPYSSMAKIDQKLEYSKNLSKEMITQILNLRNQGESALSNGKIEESEIIFNKALALFK